jgi:hypothetical protein
MTAFTVGGISGVACAIGAVLVPIRREADIGARYIIIFFMAITLLMAVVALAFLLAARSIYVNGTAATARITSIKKEESSKYDRYRVSLSYEVDGKVMTGTSRNAGFGELKEGDNIIIFYNAEDPSRYVIAPLSELAKWKIDEPEDQLRIATQSQSESEEELREEQEEEEKFRRELR